ncbi:gamma-glutamyltransferase family protein [Aquibacillus koreensis]|uniref:Gamma-glutamyltransferase family protein n=1 Tax=Aquibacillus koreensis TaxID=279446 RepID=A0A9X4AKM2_9BACI|nr:gamma-glutamyltransferase family protein [Aquibacillus koreensis]MCT2537222.1 gamma-glutamyltransferase family protein [Aquibacillus koreensis]MDC3421570.1 gamma-glutamyltransferase family protein [Aquibacillus koreensis]
MSEKGFDLHAYPYASQRMTTVANRGMVATSQPLAAQAGLDILKKGGNAIDAAIATAATLTVVEPTSNGIGSDAFALVWTKGKLHGLNASGPAPKNISIDQVKKRGHEEIPLYGWTPVTVPGAPSAWATLSERFGKLPLEEVLQPAIDYAEHGYPLSPTLSYYWNKLFEKYKQAFVGEEFKHWFDTFAPKGRSPKVGEIWSSAAHAKTLRAIAETKAETFYRGEIADQIAAFSKKYNGFLTKEDLADYKPEWVDPISVNYRGYDVWEIPPNGQGLIALQALNTVKGFTFDEKESVDTYHKQIEAMKLAFTDGQTYITDQKYMKQKVSGLLSDAYAEERRQLIGNEALTPKPGTPPSGGTVYLATADQEGNMVSFIQSNYHDFGSGLVVPGTGIALQNRGKNFSLDPNHDNALAGGKRTYHTIIPGFLTKDKEAVGPFGVMGGFMQPQGHMQVIMNMIDFGLNPQAALDAPRWQWVKDKKILIEPHFSTDIARALERKGHDIQVILDKYTFGRGEIIWRDQQTGTLYGGTEARTDGTIASY